jgi:dipeptidyl aminopeptidase/acylaminoacyl peptidase
MIKHFALAASVAAAALSATPAIARPMSATDMQMMRRLTSPSVSPDGRYAIFALSTTDLSANKRNNVIHILVLKAKVAAPQPLAGITAGAHDAVFGADGAIWYLAPVDGQDQLFRMAVGGQPAQLSNLSGDISGFKVSASGSRLILWADRDLKCTDFTCAGVKKVDQGGSTRE